LGAKAVERAGGRTVGGEKEVGFDLIYLPQPDDRIGKFYELGLISSSFLKLVSKIHLYK